ncbi:reverse transcriptase [Fusarium oxysporum f. sp. phaseoli]
MARLNNFLYRISATESSTCVRGQAAETIGYFLFKCTKWKTQWDGMMKCSQRKMGNLSFFWGGKAAPDGDKWAPDMQAV